MHALGRVLVARIPREDAFVLSDKPHGRTMGWDHRCIVGAARYLFYLTLFDGGKRAKISDGVQCVSCDVR